MHSERAVTPGRLRRLAEELAEADLDPVGWCADPGALVDELDYALRPPVHERRVPTYGSIVSPTVAPEGWGPPTGLEVVVRPTRVVTGDEARRFADGLASWVVRGGAGVEALAVFDRAAGSERDLVVLAGATGATLVQRHPTGTVRMVGEPGVARWDGMTWHREPPTTGWVDAVGPPDDDVRATLARLLMFAVHDLGARGIGSLLVLRHDDGAGPRWEDRLDPPPPLRIDRPSDLAPLRHVLSQVDGAAVFDRSGTLRQLGVRLVPSPEAESGVDAYRGTRHTAARRYSYDDPGATVVAVSEDGPVSVLRNGQVVERGGSAPPLPPEAGAGAEG